MPWDPMVDRPRGSSCIKMPGRLKMLDQKKLRRATSCKPGIVTPVLNRY